MHAVINAHAAASHMRNSQYWICPAFLPGPQRHNPKRPSLCHDASYIWVLASGIRINDICTACIFCRLTSTRFTQGIIVGSPRGLLRRVFVGGEALIEHEGVTSMNLTLHDMSISAFVLNDKALGLHNRYRWLYAIERALKSIGKKKEKPAARKEAWWKNGVCSAFRKPLLKQERCQYAVKRSSKPWAWHKKMVGAMKIATFVLCLNGNRLPHGGWWQRSDVISRS